MSTKSNELILDDIFTVDSFTISTEFPTTVEYVYDSLSNTTINK